MFVNNRLNVLSISEREAGNSDSSSLMVVAVLFRSNAKALRAAALGSVLGKSAITLAKMKRRIARIIQPSHQAPNHLFLFGKKCC